MVPLRQIPHPVKQLPRPVCNAQIICLTYLILRPVFQISLIMALSAAYLIFV